MSSAKSSDSIFQRIAHVIRAELALYPGRLSLIARIILACTSVMLLVMIFRIPGAALGAYYPLLLSRDSPRSTRRSAVRTATVCILGTAEIILGAMLFSGSPLLHFLWVAGNLFGIFYLISILKIYDSALALGLIITNAITTWDLPMSPDMRIKQTLFTLLSILLGCAISVAIESLFAQMHPPDSVLEGIQKRLTLVENLLLGYGRGEQDHSLLRVPLERYATRGTGELRALLAHSSYASTYREQLATVLALSGQLVELAANLPELTPNPSAGDLERCSVIARNIAAIRSKLLEKEAPDWLDLSEDTQRSSPTLVEIERNVELIAQSFFDETKAVHHHLPEPGEEREMRIFVSNAFTSNDHIKFALRGSLSALACYLFYMSVGWTGLNASIATCVLTALSNTGSSRHKQLMRFAGVILGACVLGFGTQALILPQIDSLFAFAILFACVIAIGAWVGTSGPRIAYAGVQIVLAYDLVNLNRFTINTSLVLARDTVLGILLGIGAMWLIFDHLWASSSTDSMRSILLAALRDVAQLGQESELRSAISQSSRLIAECDRINRNFDRLRSFSDFSVFESFPRTQEELYFDRFIKTLLPQLRAFLLVKTGMLQHRDMAEDHRNREIESRVRQRSSEILLDVAQAIEGYPLQPWRTIGSDSNLHTSVRLEQERGLIDGRADLVTEMRLCTSLLDLAHHLHAGSRAR